jgi:hypothetical protein
MTESTFRALNNKYYGVTVDNSRAGSHNINIDYPTYHCFAISEAEAVGKMILSDFGYKHCKIHKTVCYDQE